MAENHQEIAGYIGRLMRDSLGRGPKSVWVSLGPSFVVIYLQDLMSPLEEILLEEQQEQVVVTTRETWMKRILPDIKATIKLMTNLEVDTMYYDWGLQNRSGIIVGVKDSYPDSGIEIAQCQDLLSEISEISAQVQKTPDKIKGYQLDERTIVVLREGILVPIEKEFIRLGQAVTLKYAKRTLEKRFLHNNTNFEHILGRHVLDDIFVDWDFEQDKSVIVFKLK